MNILSVWILSSSSYQVHWTPEGGWCRATYGWTIKLAISLIWPVSVQTGDFVSLTLLLNLVMEEKEHLQPGLVQDGKSTRFCLLPLGHFLSASRS